MKRAETRRLPAGHLPAELSGTLREDVHPFAGALLVQTYYWALIDSPTGPSKKIYPLKSPCPEAYGTVIVNYTQESGPECTGDEPSEST